MIQEHDRAVLTAPIEAEGLLAGDERGAPIADDVGTVVHVYSGGKGFEIEFFTLMGKTAAVASVPAEAVRPARQEDRLHVRVAA
jgi:hypothetical protein